MINMSPVGVRYRIHPYNFTGVWWQVSYIQ